VEKRRSRGSVSPGDAGEEALRAGGPVDQGVGGPKAAKGVRLRRSSRFGGPALPSRCRDRGGCGARGRGGLGGGEALLQVGGEHLRRASDKSGFCCIVAGFPACA